MFFTKIDADISNSYDPNVYVYDYLVTEKRTPINHFIPKEYLKEGTKRKMIARSQAYLCKNNDKYVSQFVNTKIKQLFHIAKLAIADTEYKNKGIITIIMCDIILAILDRELAWGENIEICLKDLSKVIIGDSQSQSTTVYHRIFRGYEKGIDTTNQRLIVKGSFVNYLFPKETRKEDIAYYKNLRSEKIERFKKLM